VVYIIATVLQPEIHQREKDATRLEHIFVVLISKNIVAYRPLARE
jgi:hypothetical protein